MPLFIGQKSLFGNTVIISQIWDKPILPISVFGSVVLVAIIWLGQPLWPLLNRPWDPNAKMASLAEDQGNKFEERGKHRLAIQAYTKAITLKPELPTAYLSRGTAYWEIGQKELARKDYLWVYAYDHAHPSQWKEEAAKIDGFKNSDEQFKKTFLSRVGGL
jgi:tetratricopeptide (TPR) repeat protein